MTLTELSLSNNQITDAGLTMVEEMLCGNTKIKMGIARSIGKSGKSRTILFRLLVVYAPHQGLFSCVVWVRKRLR
jgi:hypothetical protein